ncbi:Com family DNA-binding transcriptional regulator [Agrobacterium vitis]
MFKAGRAFAGDIEIKCRRCGTINHLRPAEPEPDRQERPNGEPAYNAN